MKEFSDDWLIKVFALSVNELPFNSTPFSQKNIKSSDNNK